MLVNVAFELDRYEQVVGYLRDTLTVQDPPLDGKVRANQMRSYVFLRRLRGFYRAVQLLLAEADQEYPETVRQYLRKRREAVKEYVLFGTHPQ